VRTLWCVALVLSASACRSPSARRFEAEVAALDRKIDALRAAQNPAKAPLVADLEATACERPEACALKALCVDAYRTQLSALGATARARELLAKPDGGPAASIEAAQAIARADLDLERSRTAMERCAERQGALRRKSRER
jgi:hypothetical protein